MIALVLVLPVAAGSATASRVPAKPSTVLSATGTVTGLDLARIAIGPTKCALGAKSAALAGSFSIGERVTIGCVSGVLRTIKLAPVTSGPRHSVVFLRAASVIPKAPGQSAKGSVSWTSGSIAPGTPDNAGASNSSPVSVSGTGPITSLDPTGVTIGDATCFFYGSDFASPSRLALVERISTSSGSLYSWLTQKLHVAVGDIAQFNCTDSGRSSSGRITIS
jgi:hypothetical protein